MGMALDGGKRAMKPLDYPYRAKSNIIVQDMEFCDIDQQAACLSGYDQKYQQMSCGKYEGWFRTALLGGDVGLFFETFNQSLDQWGSSPSDRYGFVFFMTQSNQGHLGDREFCGDQLLVLPPGHSFDFRAQPHTSYCVVSIDKPAFDAVLQSSIQSDRQLNAIQQSTLIFNSPDTLMLLRQLVTYVIKLLQSQNRAGVSMSTVNGAKRSLIELLAGFIADHAPNSAWPATLETESSVFLTGQIRDFIRDKGGVDISPILLAQEFQISRRRLELMFRRQFNQSPADYIQTVKLNEFRSALMRPENLENSIGDIAAQSGFWHLSRLAQIYRQHFGELPSELRMSLRKAPT